MMHAGSHQGQKLIQLLYGLGIGYALLLDDEVGSGGNRLQERRVRGSSSLNFIGSVAVHEVSFSSRPRKALRIDFESGCVWVWQPSLRFGLTAHQSPQLTKQHPRRRRRLASVPLHARLHDELPQMLAGGVRMVVQ